MRKLLGAFFWLACPLLADPAVPTAPTASPPPSAGSPQDARRVSASTKLSYVQGGLVDIRYGQVAIDVGGDGVVLEVKPETVLRLDGSPITAEELLPRIASGLAAVASYDHRSGTARTVDAFSDGRDLPSVQVELLPKNRTVFAAQETVTVLMPREQVRRLGPNTNLSIPGLAHGLAWQQAEHGAKKVVLRVPHGADLNRVPILVHTPNGVHKGGPLSTSSTEPKLTSYGPQNASSRLERIPGWVDVTTVSQPLDPATARLQVSLGVRIVDFQPRVDRSVFRLETDGPGDYWIEFTIADTMGRAVRQRWPLKVLP